MEVDEGLRNVCYIFLLIFAYFLVDRVARVRVGDARTSAL
jgi:hypothetical protein